MMSSCRKVLHTKIMLACISNIAHMRYCTITVFIEWKCLCFTKQWVNLNMNCHINKTQILQCTLDNFWRRQAFQIFLLRPYSTHVMSLHKMEPRYTNTSIQRAPVCDHRKDPAALLLLVVRTGGSESGMFLCFPKTHKLSLEDCFSFFTQLLRSFFVSTTPWVQHLGGKLSERVHCSLIQLCWNYKDAQKAQKSWQEIREAVFCSQEEAMTVHAPHIDGLTKRGMVTLNLWSGKSFDAIILWGTHTMFCKYPFREGIGLPPKHFQLVIVSLA